MTRVKLNGWFLVLALTVFSFSTIADDYAVVRYLEGKAYVQGGASGEREALTINSPLFEGDNLWVTEGNAGIIFGDGTLIWLTTGSHLEIIRFPYPYSEEPVGLRANLWRGSMLLEAKFPVPTEASHLIGTPAAAVRSARKCLALVEVESIDRTRVTVLDGSAVLSSGGRAATVWGNRMSYAEYGYEPMTPVSVGDMPYPEVVAFRERMTDRPVRSAKSWEYLDPELYPYATDLDYYGYWEDVPGYGHVWYPSPAFTYSGWNPYFNGYWHYTPWGCTWISYEPWGWVPFHYGRWTFVIGVGWGWIPDPFFSPAWVAWYWGDGWIGWCPMGYWGPLWEPCGWWTVNINNIYVTNVTKVVTVHKDGPPPVKPIIPVSKKNMDRTGIKKTLPKSGGDVIVTPHGGLNIHPTKVGDLQVKKSSVDDFRKIAAELPVSGRERRVSPSSLDIQKKTGSVDPASSGRTRNADGFTVREAPDRVGAASVTDGYRRPVNTDDGRTRYSDVNRTEPNRDPARSRETPTVEPSSRETPVREAPATGRSDIQSRSSGSVSPPASSYSRETPSGSSSTRSGASSSSYGSSGRSVSPSSSSSSSRSSAGSGGSSRSSGSSSSSRSSASSSKSSSPPPASSSSSSSSNSGSSSKKKN